MYDFLFGPPVLPSGSALGFWLNAEDDDYDWWFHNVYDTDGDDDDAHNTESCIIL